MIEVDQVVAKMAASNISTSTYAKRTRSLIKLITDLRALGAQADFPLPRIAVIGNQSAGKSSLVEAISGITVPRASGTCTRCPMECRLTHSDSPWQCQILLRRETDEYGNKIQSKETPFGPLLHDKTQLEEMLRRAQLAILNPSLPSSVFEDFDTKSLKPGETPPGSTKQLAFSNDVVCLDLRGPDVTDLSFIDLPGIISNVASGEDRGNIDAVKNMVKEHIKGNTLILLTITMRDDIDNQGAAFLAREEDPDGLRTIGVLTKPDLIQHGEDESWLRVLEGSSHPLKHGYFVTKQPSPKELEEKVTFEDARRRETTFFEATAPWCNKPDLRRRMGTANLTAELSRLLGSVINQALPVLRQQSKESSKRIADMLDSLPPPPSENPAAELIRLITTFSGEVESVIQGRESHEGLIQMCRPAYVTFKKDIRATAPQFRPYVNADADPRAHDCIEIDDGDATLADEGTELPQEMYLNDVKRHIEQSLTRQLPFNVPFSAKISLIDSFSVDWKEYSEKCFSTVHAATTKVLKEIVASHFSQFNTALPDHVGTIVEDLVQRRRAATLERVQWLLDLESPPFTNNDHYFSVYRTKYLTRYKEARKTNEQPLDMEKIREALAALAAAGYTGVKEDQLPKLYGDDPYEQELIVMAETAAYFHVAYKRIIDNIPRIIDHDFLHAIGKMIQECLIRGLNLVGEQATDRAAIYLAEDEDISQKRKLLKQKQERIAAVLKRLFEFGV